MHTHWIVWAYRSRLDNGDYQDVTTIEVIAESQKEALKKVEGLFPLSLKGGVKGGAGYRFVSVIEHLPGACASNHV